MSKIEALDIAPYVSDKDAFFDRIVYDGKKMDLFKYDDPKILDAGGIAICMEGSVEFSIDTRSYILHKGDMCVFFPQMTIQPSHRSKDLKLYIAFVNVDFFQNFMMPTSVTLYAYISDNPCIRLNPDEVDMMMSMGDLIKAKYEREDNVYRKEIAEKLLEAISYEMAALYQKRQPMEGKENSHCRTVFYKFLALVENDYIISRRVSYYADKMFMTPKYLSALVKEASGRGANDWINDTVILNAKILIKKSDMTVQQVSDMLHFPNPSFFGQYFKRYTGMTPNKFKTQK